MPYANSNRQRAAKAEHARRARASRVEPIRGTLRPLVADEVRISTAADVLRVLAEQVAAVGSDEESRATEKARTIASLAGVALRAIEAADLAGRVEAVEMALDRRSDA